MIPTGRILSDGSNREQWKQSRQDVIGASDAKTYSKLESVPLYVRAKLRRDAFTGNVFTENGYRFEPLILGWAGHDHNVALFHAPDEPGFAATPDGVTTRPDGHVALAECKVKHVDPLKRTKGPVLGEWRQVAWQFRVFPEAEHLDWCWADLDKNGNQEDLIDDEPKMVRIYPDDPKVLDLQSKVEPIATEVLALLRSARQLEREMAI